MTTFKPILFSTPMVQALLEGRKTMTRRTKGLEKFNEASDSWRYDNYDIATQSHYMELISSDGKFTEKYFEVVCPYKIGDILWVRENFYTAANFDHWKPSTLSSCDVEVYYAADIPNHSISKPLHRGKNRPCIFLPFEYARIFLKVKAIRVERLQDISESDAKAEGAKDTLKYDEMKQLSELGDWNIPRPFLMHQFGFLYIWCKINGCKNWLTNPFVWVIEFERIEKPNNFI